MKTLNETIRALLDKGAPVTQEPCEMCHYCRKKATYDPSIDEYIVTTHTDTCEYKALETAYKQAVEAEETFEASFGRMEKNRAEIERLQKENDRIAELIDEDIHGPQNGASFKTTIYLTNVTFETEDNEYEVYATGKFETYFLTDDEIEQFKNLEVNGNGNFVLTYENADNDGASVGHVETKPTHILCRPSEYKAFKAVFKAVLDGYSDGATVGHVESILEPFVNTNPRAGMTSQLLGAFAEELKDYEMCSVCNEVMCECPTWSDQ